MRNRQDDGFTLIELMIVVAIVGILSAIAYPSYIEQVRKSHRADAQAALMENAQFLERRFTTQNSYLGDWAGADDANGALPVLATPRDGGTTRYTLSVTDIAANRFTLQATAVGAQADDACGNLSLEHTGARSASQPGDNCW